MPASGGPLQLLSGLPTFAGGFSQDASGVVFPVQQRGSVRLDHYDLATGETSTIGTLPDHVFRGALSPDGTRIALARGEIVSDVLLLTMRRE
jgi:Tol biopolymer transport system component